MPLALDQLTLKPASEAQKIEARRQASTEWGKWLDTEGYLRRMELLDTFEHASDGKTLVWVLVPTEDQETLNVLSMCVTYRRDIFILPPNEIKAISSTGYGIASVFTPPRSRGKGYAARMMSLLHFALAKFDGIPAFPPAWGKQPPVQVEQPGALSVLYSGIGSYYLRCAPSEGTGWTIVGTKTTHWIADQVDIRGPHPKVESLSQEEAVSVIVTDAALFKRDFESQGPSSYIHFTFRPAEAWCRFQMDRDMGHPLYIERPPRTWGARLQDETGETHFIVWTYRPALEVECKLIIVSLRASPTTFPPLFATMVSVARESGHNIIEAWNLEHELDKVVVETGGRTFDRTSQLPAMKWYGPEKNVLWFGNNKLHWC